MSGPVTAYPTAGNEPRTYAPRALDELGRALRAGQVARVVFPTEAELLAALWDGVLTTDELSAVKIDFQDPAGALGAISLCGVLAAWRDWSRRRQRRRTVAGLVLSVIALAATWLLLALAR